jgi:hypothetical protein
MTASKEWYGERLVVRIDGTFDSAAEWELHSILAETTECTVKLDFGRVRDFQDLAVAMLARDLAQNARRVELLGLRHHQLTILRYLGIDMRNAEPPAESA